MRPKPNLRLTLILAMIAAGILPMLVSGVIIHRQATLDLETITFEKLRGDAVNRKAFLESYLTTIADLNVSMAGEPWLAEALRRFDGAHDTVLDDVVRSLGSLPDMRSLDSFYERDFVRALADEGGTAVPLERLVPRGEGARLLQHLYIADNPSPLGEKDAMEQSALGIAYDWQHKRYHAPLRDFQRRFALRDVFLIEPDAGDVVYSVFKSIDFGTSLFDGPHDDSGLARVAREAMDLASGEVAVSDLGRYLPSYGTGAFFVATPVHEGDRLVGALAFEMPLGRVNDIMGRYDGLGETGGATLVGADYLRRSQSRYTDVDTVLKDEIRLDAVDKAISGETSVDHETLGARDYLIAYTPVKFGDVTWALLTRMATDEALGSVARLTRTLWIVAGSAALLVALCAVLLGRRLHRTLGGDPSDIYRVAEAIENGDLSAEPGDAGKSGAYAAIVRMRERLREVLRETQRIAEEVRTGAAGLSAGNVGLSERTEQQASNLEETASSTEQLTSTVRQNAENARTANRLAIDTRERATTSGEVAARAIDAMQDINTSSERIADIIGVIDEIAFQTNLLALNAAVEAARAGEQGRGFAVVASEVRQLAGRSASAAKEIKVLIEDSVRKVQDGTGLVQESGAALDEILGSVASLTEIVGQIAVASDEQTAGIEQINQALVHMDGVTQQNAALVGEATATSHAMSEQAALLSTRIGYFSEGRAVRRDSRDETLPSAALDAAPSCASRRPLALAAVAVDTGPSGERERKAHEPPLARSASPRRTSDDGELWEEF